MSTLKTRETSPICESLRLVYPVLINSLIDQIEFANVILLNKTDVVSKDQVNKAEQVVRALNRRVLIRLGGIFS